MRQFGLIGYPLSHSFSKKYFSDKFEKLGITGCSYDIYPIPDIDQLPALLKDQPLLQGLNVTIPYKEKVIPFLTNANEVVQKIKACNCIRIEKGHLTGFNTDVIGFEISLKEKLGPHHRQALILGTGGAAKAVEYVLGGLGIHYRYVSRNPLAGQLGYEQLNTALIKECTLIINTTPLGMYPHTAACPPIPYELLGPNHYLFDLIYNPAQTRFLEWGAAKGAVIQNGMQMLVLQAEESWRIWNL
jgi:shikimate dehydrogenase